MIFDTHSHLQFDDFIDIEKELRIMEAYDVKYTTLIWSDYNSTLKSIKLARKYNNLFVVAWIIHPIDAPKLENLEEEYIKVRKLIIENRDIIVWIWEVWFDYFHINKDRFEQEKEIQRKAFIKNYELAQEFGLPIIIHNRDAWEDTYEMLMKLKTPKFVIHCYTGNYNWAMKFLDLSPDAYIGFSGIVTFKNSIEVQETASKIPLERILVETDAPYLAPAPYRWKLNTPWYTKYNLDKIKELRKETPELIENQIFENSLKFYWIK